MAKGKNINHGDIEENLSDIFRNQTVVHRELTKEMKTAFMDYSMSVAVSRALPDVRDGLKPVHRRILYTMYEDNLFPNRPYLKSATTVGDVLGRYHPHGDSSVYDAMVRLAQPFSLRYPLVDGHGNFGNIDGDAAAAYRYTEARMAKMATEMVRDIEKDTVRFGLNYDERLKEPTVLPSRFPNMLVNGAVGIAVGMATSIPPHNLREVVDGLIYLMENPEATSDELMLYVKGPDFPTGGIIMGRAGLRQAYQTGRGRITVRARTEIQEEKDSRYRIVITEIPYLVNKAKLIQDIADHVNNKRIEGIRDLRDESDRRGLTIVIELKKDANPQVVLNHLFMNTQLQDTFSVILLALQDGEPKILTLKQMMECYISFQKEIILRRTEFDLKKAKERAHIVEGLLKALDYIDEIIALIRASKTIADAKTGLMETWSFSEIQAQCIVEMRLGQLTGLEREKLDAEYADLKTLIADLTDVLNSDAHVVRILKEELLVIREKYGDERRTELANVENEIDIEDLIQEKNCVYTRTHLGYIKRQAENVYKVQGRGGRGVTAMTPRDEDFVEDLFVGSTHDIILFFTTFGRVFKVKGYEIPEASRQAKGMNLVNLLQLESGETVSSIIPIQDFEEGLYLNMVTRKGISKRSDLLSYKNIRKGGLIAVTLDEGDELVSVHLTDGKQKILVATSGGMAIEYEENQVSVVGRQARGVRCIRLEEGETVVGSVVVDEAKTLLTICENGYGKRTEFSAYHPQNRGGKGMKCHSLSEKTGKVTGVKAVEAEADAVIISSSGVLIRVRIAQIPVYGRSSSGVRIMRLMEDDRVVNLATIPVSEEEEPIPAEE